jgi:hypothetical protein
MPHHFVIIAARRSQIFICIVLWLTTLSCTHDPVIPDTPAISFSQQVSPIFSSNCARSSCHDGYGQFSLENYSSIRSRVLPGDARKSELYKAITTLAGPGTMPPDGPLTDQQINLIYAWIMQGAKQN